MTRYRWFWGLVLTLTPAVLQATTGEAAQPPHGATAVSAPGRPPMQPVPPGWLPQVLPDPTPLLGCWEVSVPDRFPKPSAGTLGEALSARPHDTPAGDALLVLLRDGTWHWQGRNGRWKRGDDEFPIQVRDDNGVGTWRIGAGPGSATILLFDGISRHEGRRVTTLPSPCEDQ